MLFLTLLPREVHTSPASADSVTKSAAVQLEKVYPLLISVLPASTSHPTYQMATLTLNLCSHLPLRQGVPQPCPVRATERTLLLFSHLLLNKAELKVHPSRLSASTAPSFSHRVHGSSRRLPQQERGKALAFLGSPVKADELSGSGTCCCGHRRATGAKGHVPADSSDPAADTPQHKHVFFHSSEL